LVDEVAELLQADASDCYLYDRERGTLRCAAVHGLDTSLVGFEFTADRGLSGLAIREGRPLVATEYGAVPDEVPHPAYTTLADGLDPRDHAIGRAAAQARVIAAPELAGDERLPEPWREAADRAGFRALLCVPVESPRQGSGGLVAVFFSEAHTFGEEDLELVRHLAD